MYNLSSSVLKYDKSETNNSFIAIWKKKVPGGDPFRQRNLTLSKHQKSLSALLLCSCTPVSVQTLALSESKWLRVEKPTWDLDQCLHKTVKRTQVLGASTG
eukprot:TRINITY_DN7403_c0_g1_i4.p1 TRINITY_DN7403_c0_g1~~TRINITY_DN7403_c0_g1_i4.p1  ORF type:complete len:101 (-),score=16.34 TRINITY_DN7403_c0_g1_i4:757-1059(-)